MHRYLYKLNTPSYIYIYIYIVVKKYNNYYIITRYVKLVLYNKYLDVVGIVDIM